MEEWKECKLSDICDYGKGRIEVSSLDNSNYISTENMLPNRAGVTTATTLPTGEYTPSFEIDDTLVSNIRPYFKKIWKATFSGGCSADVLVFKAKENISKEYLYYVLSDDEFFKYSMATSKGTKMPRGDKTSIMNYPVKLPPLPTQANLSLGTIKSLPIIIPDSQNLDKYTALIEPLFKQMKQVENENKKLANLRDTILPKLINGEIEV